MPVPMRVARWNRAGPNRLARQVFPWLPGLAVVVHRGRRSGRRYQTPVNVFTGDDGRFIIALTYGAGTDWVKNVLAAGGCEIRTRGRRFQARDPRVYHDESRQQIRPAFRPFLRLLRVSDFLSLTIVS
jgi:deazaflavin-dependent oxidoreductase (nitroreductase family)